MKLLLVVILSIFASAEGNKKSNLRAARRLEEAKDDSALTQDGAHLTHASPDLLSMLSNAIDWHHKYAARDESEGLPARDKPDICAEGTPGNYRPRSQAKNCAKAPPASDYQMDVDENLVYDPRHQLFHEQQAGHYKVDIRCNKTEHNIDMWFAGAEFDSIEKKILQSWDASSKAQANHEVFGWTPISSLSQHDEDSLGANDSCMVTKAQLDSCHQERLAACAAQGEAIIDGSLHAELMHRVSTLLECSMKHDEWEKCDDHSTGPDHTIKYKFWKKNTVDDAHLNTYMPQGVNIVPNGGGAGPTTPRTEACIDFAVKKMCTARCEKNPGDCGCKSEGLQKCISDFCSKFRENHQPQLVHQEGGTGVEHTNSNGKLVPGRCVDPSATWIVLSWPEVSAGPKLPKGSLTVFGCPSENTKSCGLHTDCSGYLPFKSWKGFITNSNIYRTEYGDESFCTLWHQQSNLADLFEKNDDPKSDGEIRATGYLQPEVCYPVENPDPFNKCINLSPDNCHFQEGTKFDPKYGQFYQEMDFDFSIHKWWYSRWSDGLDWRQMLPVCFGCNFESCASPQSRDDGRGFCDNLDDYADPEGHKTKYPIWYHNNYPRSPLQRMTNPSGESVVRDQGSCGSCWAFTSMSTASHLTCIQDCKKNGRCAYDNIITGANFLEPWQANVQSILSCNSQQAGCDGGWMRYGDEVYENFGMMKEKNFPCNQVAAKDSQDFSYTGNANLRASCADFYEYACATGSCRRTVNAENGSTACNGGMPAVGDWDPATNHGDICQNQWGAACPYSWDYYQYPASSGWVKHTGIYNLKHVQVSGWYNVGTSCGASDWETCYKEHLINVGPFGVAFDTYNNFPWNGCNTGIDEDHVWTVGSDRATIGSGHAVTVVGYGWAFNVCTGCGANGCTSGWMQYWTIQNSWGRNWGNGGYFRIRRGTNEARIESWAATAPSVDVSCPKQDGDIPYYGGAIKTPQSAQKTKVDIIDDSWFAEHRHIFKPEEPRSNLCPAAHWDTKMADHLGPFKTVHNIEEVLR